MICSWGWELNLKLGFSEKIGLANMLLLGLEEIGREY